MIEGLQVTPMIIIIACSDNNTFASYEIYNNIIESTMNMYMCLCMFLHL
jgi:hypothetical protein